MADNSDFTPLPTKELKVFTDTNPPALGPTVSGETVIMLAFRQWMAQDEADRQSNYRTFRDYYDGEHLYQLTDRMLEFLELDANVKFDLNYLPIPIDILQERLRVTGFDAENDQGGDEGVFWQWWTDNRMDAVQGDVHHAMLRDGDTYALVGWDNENEMPTITHEAAYDGTNGMMIVYDEERRGIITAAVKRWRIENGPNTGSTRINVYLPDFIYKYIVGSKTQEFIEFDENGNELPWPLPWLDSDGRPVGVPVVHFRNNAGGYDFGKSELKDLIPVQDALNKAAIDEIAGADIEGFSLITLSGGQAPADDLKIGPRRVIHAPEGTWSSIAAGDLQNLTRLVTAYIVRMAQMSRTPLSYFQVTGAVASSDTQKADDTGLVSKAESRSVETGNAWEDVMIIGRKLHNAFGDGGMEEVSVSTRWASFERVDKLETELKRAQVVDTLVRAGSTFEGAAGRADYSEEEIDAMVGEVIPVTGQ